MSRRRASGPAPFAPSHPNQKKRGFFPAELCAAVDLEDPSGHRLVRFGRYYSEQDPSAIWWDAKTKHKRVKFGATTQGEASEPAGPARWGVLYFACKSCAEDGKTEVSSIRYDDVEAAVNALWDEATSTEDVNTPRVVRLRTRPL